MRVIISDFTITNLTLALMNINLKRAKNRMVGRMKKMRWVVWIGCLFFAGCASVDTPPFEKRAEVSEALKQITEPFPYNVAVMDVRENNQDGVKGSANIITDVLEKTSLFRSVTVVTETDIQTALETAYKNGADILILPQVLYGDVRYEDYTGWRIPKVVIWSISEFLSALIADEVYSVEALATLDLYSTHNRRSPPVRIEARSKTRVTLNDYQRGFKIWGIWRVPSSLHEGNYKKIREKAEPAVNEDLKTAVFFTLTSWCEPVRLAKLFKKPEMPKIPATPTPSVPTDASPTEPKKDLPYEAFILAMGRDTEETPSAERSAWQFLNTVKGMVKGENVAHLLVGDSAKLSQVEELVKGASVRGAKTVILYLALPADASGNVKLKSPPREFNIENLLSIVQMLRSERIVLLCDLVAPHGVWRYSGGSTTLVLFTRSPGEKFLLKGDVSLFCATFSTLFRIADTNANGTVTAKELEAVLGAWFMRQARLLKSKQTATVAGGAEIPFGAK
ncbi:MAG: hypothetical protein N2234_02580 [Planctomycetota bacterium]|nr:hypothetical protein [Planctomycetota bacterium]